MDIARLCVLLLCGGMYIDLDVMPNREKYYEVPFAVQRIERGRWKHAKKETKASQKKWKHATKGKGAKKKLGRHTKSSTTMHKSKRPTAKLDFYYDMEVIIASARNPTLMRWLNDMLERVDTLPYGSGHWKTARMRYVLKATGPYVLNTFLKHKRNKDVARSIGYITCNVQKGQATMTPRERMSCDVISYDSVTWKTRKDFTVVPLCEERKSVDDLPLMRLLRRVSTKCPQVDASSTNVPVGMITQTERNNKKICMFINSVCIFHALDKFFTEDAVGKQIFQMLPPEIQEQCSPDSWARLGLIAAIESGTVVLE